MPVTIDDVARHLNISVSTVSKALNGYSDVSTTTKERIQETARMLGYHPNMAARNLRRRRTEKIGVVANYPIDQVNDFLSELIPGMAAAAEQADYNLILYTSAARHPEQISKICRAREADGLLLLWPSQLEETVALMAQEAMPYIVLPRRVPYSGISYIAADHQSSGQTLTEHLIELGHTRIGFTTYPEVHESNTDRIKGYQSALEKADIPFDEQLIIETSSQDTNNGARILNAYLAMEKPPTAILCFNDPIAMRLLAAANARGIRIPEDLSITGHDGILTSGMTVPALTTARQPIPQMGQLAVECLLVRIADPGLPPAQHLLPIELIRRGTTSKVLKRS